MYVFCLINSELRKTQQFDVKFDKSIVLFLFFFAFIRVCEFTCVASSFLSCPPPPSARPALRGFDFTHFAVVSSRSA